MAAGPSAYLVVRRDDGFGDVHPLKTGLRYTLGRAATNLIVLRDDMCSREHAEIFQTEGAWFLRDLGSLNGSRVNNQPITTDFHLAPGSDAIDAGEPRADVPADLDGIPRPQGAGWDAGAYEALELIFRDGFESGDTSAWSASTP